MSIALRLPIHMTVDEFDAWEPPDGLRDRRWQLVDGEPVCRAPPSDDHGAIQGETARLVGNWLRRHRPECRVIVTPGVIPRMNSRTNERIPDLGITCGPRNRGATRSDHLVLIEILSPSNEAVTRSNVWAYCSIPSVREIVLLSSTAIGAEVMRRQGDGGWPQEPEPLGADDRLVIEGIRYSAPLADHYATSSLAKDGSPRPD